MLKYLTIKNYAIVSSLEIEFQAGLNVITGETGAGKSITFDALNFVLGCRADSKVVRAGADRCDIIAEFDLGEQNPILNWLQTQELADGEHCILKRTIHSDGRSRSFINDQPCSLQTTRTLANQLVHIHGQHENLNSLSRDGQRDLVDAYAKHDTLVAKVKQCYHAYLTTQQQLEQLTQQVDQADRQDFIRYQLSEFSELDLSSLDLKSLEAQQTQLAHAEDILNSCELLRLLLSETETSCLSQLHKSLQIIAKLPDSSPTQNISQCITTTEIHLNEAISHIQDYAEQVDIDPQHLSMIEQQLDKVYQLARKHRVKPHELVDTEQALTTELAQLENSAEAMTTLQHLLTEQRQAYDKAATALTKSRNKSAKQLAQAILPYLHQLGLPQCQFEIRINQDKSTPKLNGFDSIEFLVSTNPGQDCQPLNKVASGGELSRISLAIQVVTAGVLAVGTLLFDEVDVGIGGNTAAIVGKLLQTLSQQAQVICVTHQAQVASFAHQHYLVSKTTDGRVTESEIKTLDQLSKIAELARMLGGMEVNQKTLEHAKDLLEQAH